MTRFVWGIGRRAAELRVSGGLTGDPLTCLASRHGHSCPPTSGCRQPLSGALYGLKNLVIFDHPYAEYLRLTFWLRRHRTCAHMFQFWRRSTNQMTHHLIGQIVVDYSLS